jgi:NAD(P)-dependent dehydrogenase (short-subunit alcohol dehydrogenase family)
MELGIRLRPGVLLRDARAELDVRPHSLYESVVIDKAGRVDISFNAVGFPDAKILGVPLVELDVEQLSLPIATYTRSYFLTARLAARRMVANRSGAIMRVTAIPSHQRLCPSGCFARASSLETEWLPERSLL